MNPYLRAARELPLLVIQAMERLNKRRESAGKPPVEPPGKPEGKGKSEGKGNP